LLAVVFPSDQVPMPGEQGVRAHYGPDLPKRLPTEVLRLGGQSNALVVGEPQPLPFELLSEHAILRPEIVDHIALVLVDPAGQGDKEKLEWMRERSHQRSVSEGRRGVVQVTGGHWHPHQVVQNRSGRTPIELLDITPSTIRPGERQSFCPLAAWPASKKVFGYFPSPQILNEPKSLYQSPSGASGLDSLHVLS